MTSEELFALEADLNSEDIVDDLIIADDIIAHAKSIGYVFDIPQSRHLPEISDNPSDWELMNRHYSSALL